MKNQTGARYIKRQKENNREKETVCTQHHMTESKLTRLPSGAVKRERS